MAYRDAALRCRLDMAYEDWHAKSCQMTKVVTQNRGAGWTWRTRTGMR